MDDIQIEPREVKQRIDRGEKFLFVDVREPWEHQASRIESAKLIPLGQIPNSLQEIENAADVILFWPPWDAQSGCSSLAAGSGRSWCAFHERRH